MEYEFVSVPRPHLITVTDRQQVDIVFLFASNLSKSLSTWNIKHDICDHPINYVSQKQEK